jgi:saccharopine dehydrogenase (NAD+, L-lysine-forming)
MIYGANGYTGKLLVAEAARRGITPILAGRRPDPVKELADRYGFPSRAFSLDSLGGVCDGLAGVDVLLLAAGPFSRTSRNCVEACIATKTHYLDITGEIPVFEACHRRSDEAKDAGIVIMPGVGFDVVPSDCLAKALAEAHGAGESLELAFSAGGGISRGTAKTMIEGLPHGAAYREGGVIKTVPVGSVTKEIPFRDRPRNAVMIGWGDVSTAYCTTGIGNIRVYMAVPKGASTLFKILRPFRSFLASPGAQRALHALIERRVQGPDEDALKNAKSRLWGRVSGDGKAVEGTLETGQGYALTAQTGIDAAIRVADGEVEPGAWTPASAFGADYIAGFDGCDMRVA